MYSKLPHQSGDIFIKQGYINFTLTLERKKGTSFGLKLVKDSDGDGCARVTVVDKKSVASAAGLRKNDLMVSLNSMQVKILTGEELEQLLEDEHKIHCCVKRKQT